MSYSGEVGVVVGGDKCRTRGSWVLSSGEVSVVLGGSGEVSVVLERGECRTRER